MQLGGDGLVLGSLSIRCSLAPNRCSESKSMHHSIRYDYDALPIYLYIDKLPLRILYLLSVASAPVFGSESWGRIPGLVLGASALLAASLFNYAFVSVWCFFAAVLAAYLCVVFYRLPKPATRTVLAIAVA